MPRRPCHPARLHTRPPNNGRIFLFVPQTAYSPLPRLQHPQRGSPFVCPTPGIRRVLNSTPKRYAPMASIGMGATDAARIRQTRPGFCQEGGSIPSTLRCLPFSSTSRMGTRTRSEGSVGITSPRQIGGPALSLWRLLLREFTFGVLGAEEVRAGERKERRRGERGRSLAWRGSSHVRTSLVFLWEILCAGSELPPSLEAEAVPCRVGEKRTDVVVLAGGRVMTRCEEGESGVLRTWSMMAAWRPLLASGERGRTKEGSGITVDEPDALGRGGRGGGARRKSSGARVPGKKRCCRGAHPQKVPTKALGRHQQRGSNRRNSAGRQDAEMGRDTARERIVGGRFGLGRCGMFDEKRIYSWVVYEYNGPSVFG
ncbi:hypothetical protein B0H14DRAFT_3164249 [Mycena olivaceomarginata]|nr:hypothetical protein B0H14DRAFT_3164249 [Mycena olivaceomarginata]